MSLLDHWSKSFSLDRLAKRLGAMPMLLVIIPIIAGVLLANNFDTPIWSICGGVVIATIGALYARPMNVAYCFVALLLTLFGSLLTELRQVAVSTPYNKSVEMQVSLVSPIAEREGYSVAEGCIKRWLGEEGWQEAEDRVQLWLRTDSLIYGDRVHILGQLRRRISKYEDYNTLMHNRGYVGGVGISDGEILGIEHDEVSGLRRYAIEKLGRYQRDTASHSVVEGMVVGSRHSMPPSLRASYSATGLSHILAVSGLHLGIIALVISLLLTPLKLLTYGHIVADMLTVAMLWLFVVISGATPSVVRAALMFSTLILVKNSTGLYNPINALACAILLMLCYNPQTLYDISFQLSVLAVMGIVAWGAPVVRSFKVKSPLSSALTSTLVIGIVATLWTMPVVSATFGSIPIVGVVATPVVLITAYMIVGCGVITLILPDPLSHPFALCAEWLASVQNSIVEWFAALPFANIQYTFSAAEKTIYYALFAIVTLLIWSRKPKTKRITLALSYIEVGEDKR